MITFLTFLHTIDVKYHVLNLYFCHPQVLQSRTDAIQKGKYGFVPPALRPWPSRHFRHPDHLLPSSYSMPTMDQIPHKPSLTRSPLPPRQPYRRRRIIWTVLILFSIVFFFGAPWEFPAQGFSSISRASIVH